MLYGYRKSVIARSETESSDVAIFRSSILRKYREMDWREGHSLGSHVSVFSFQFSPFFAVCGQSVLSVRFSPFAQSAMAMRK